MAGVSQDDTTVTADVRGPDGPGQISARYLVGCDGAHSRVRDSAGIPFPGITYPEVNRLGQATVPDSVTRPDNGDLDVPGVGRVRRGFTRTDRGVFAFGRLASGVLMIQTTEDEAAEPDDDTPMTLTEFQGSIRRVLGGELPLEEVTRLSRYGFAARQAESVPDRANPAGRRCGAPVPRHRHRHQRRHARRGQPGLEAGRQIQGWAPAGLLDTYHDERHFAGARAMLQAQAQVALRRGQDPAGAGAPGTLHRTGG